MALPLISFDYKPCPGVFQWIFMDFNDLGRQGLAPGGGFSGV